MFLVVALTLAVYVLTSSSSPLMQISLHDRAIPSSNDLQHLKTMRDTSGKAYSCVLPSQLPEESKDNSHELPRQEELLALLVSNT